MVFSSTIFLFAFLPLFLAVYFAMPWRPAKNVVLLLFSLLFYAWGEPVYVWLMVASICFNWLFAFIIGKCGEGKTAPKRFWLVAALAANLLVLGFYKYQGFLAENINRAIGEEFIAELNLALPIGISFFTLQAITYVVDVYRGEVKVQKNPLYLGMYIAMFPQLVAGPIVRYTTVMEEIAHREESLTEFAAGATRFCFGLAKKMVLANSMGQIADGVFGQTAANLDPGLAWVGALAYTFQIYFDFSAYSDMAIGLGRMFGFHFLENFNYPYISRSVTEFWRRWHISLSSWFRDYVYIPLGGNRCSRPKQIRNILAVWLLTGLWHGAAWTFILWGLWFCVLLLGEKFLWGKYLERLPGLIRWACAMLAVILSWVLFRAADLEQALAYLGAMFSQTTGLAQDGQAVYYLLQFWPEWILALIAFLPVKQWLQSWLEARGAAGQTLALWAPRGLALGLLVLSYGLLVTGSFNPFIYFQF